MLGALGSGLHAPLVAEQRWAGGTRKVVLSRPAPPAAAAASSSTSWRVVAPEDRVTLEGTDYSLVRFAGRVDVGAVLARHPDGLGPGLLAAIAAEVLEALAAAGCSHGALDAGAVRLDEHGVYVVGFRGREADDALALSHLVEDWGPAPPPLLAAIAARDVDTLRGLAAPWSALRDLVRSVPEPALFEHPWAGRALTQASVSSGPPPKVRAAAIAGLTLVLGWCAAWFYLAGGQ